MSKYDPDMTWEQDVYESMPPLLTIKQAAQLLHKCERTVHQYITDGDLESTRLETGRSVLIPRLCLIRFMGGSVDNCPSAST